MGYINGNSERFQILVATEEIVDRNVQSIGDQDQSLIGRTSISAFVFLIVPHAGVQDISHCLRRETAGMTEGA